VRKTLNKQMKKNTKEEEKQEQIRIRRSSTRLPSKCEIQQKKFSHTQVLMPLAAIESPR
jgi:hypothetical protein